MRLVRTAAAAAAMAAGLAVAGASTTDQAADTLVADAVNAPARVSYSGTIEFVRIGGSGSSEASVYRIEHLAPDRTREEYTAPSSLRGDEILTLGRATYAIDANRKRIVESENDEQNDRTAFAANYALLRKNYHAVARGEENFDGRSASVVALVNNYSHKPCLVVRIDRASKLVLDKQQFGPDGTMIAEMRFEEIAYAPPPAAADFAIPSNYATVKGPTHGTTSEAIAALVRSAGFGAKNPSALPLGFAPAEGKLETIEGVRTLHLLYSDGLRSASLFESASPSSIDMTRFHPQATTVGSTGAQYGEEGATVLLAWSDGTLHYVLVGQLSLSEMQAIAASVDSAPAR